MKTLDVEKHASAIDSPDGLPIRYDLYVPKNVRSVKPILFLHGFKGFKDWGLFPAFCRDLASAGFAVIAFNFSHNGTDDSLTELNQMDLFRRQTLSQNLDEVGHVIAALDRGEIGVDGCRIDSSHIGIIGHSRGGTTAVAATAEYREIGTLVTWSAVSDFRQYWPDELKSQWEKQGVAWIKNARTGADMPLDEIVYRDTVENSSRINASTRITEVYAPALFVHGSGDEAVSSSHSRQLWHRCASDEKEIKIIDGAGHTFGVSHPPETQDYPEHFEQVADATISWFLHYHS